MDPNDIAAIVCGPQLVASGAQLLVGKTVLVTAGPTREPIDPVRYITNHSSGKMGYAIAAAAAEQGARVVLISGPTAIPAPVGADVHYVQTAEEMYAASHVHVGDADIFVSAAAVADYRPATWQEQKIKKSEQTMSIELVRSPDILASIADLENAPFTVGFAAETENVREYAIGKLEKKNLDIIVANQVGENRGFDSDENTVDLYWAGGEQSFDTAEKTELARDIVKLVAERYELAKIRVSVCDASN